MNLKTKLEEMRKRCEAATPGPWDKRCLNAMDNMAAPRMVWGEYGWVAEAHGFREICISNAAFIAASRTDMPALIAALEVCLQALEYINTHELYHGVNQGMPSEQTSKEALLRVEEILGNVSAALASQGEEE